MSITSAGYFIFVTGLVALYYLVPKQYQKWILLSGSYGFYAVAGPLYLPFILITTISAYFAAKTHKYMGFTIVLNIGILSMIKSFASIGGNLSDAFIPLGISFYTLQVISYVIDVHYKKIEPEYNFWNFALYVSFFPQLVQGPINRYGDIAPTLLAEHKFSKDNFLFGTQRIIWGIFKKLVIADRIGIAVDIITGQPETYRGFYVFVGMMCYAVELYSNFTGGIDIAIGTAQLFGITMKENFNRPFFAKSIKDFWRRWHISMGTWFTEYVFYPVSVWKPMLKLSKFSRKHFGKKIGKRIPVYLSTIVVWSATGLWHGFGWNFLAWGWANCFVMIVSQELTGFYRWFHGKWNVAHTNWFRFFQVVRTILLMSLLRTFDCYHGVMGTFSMWKSLLFDWNMKTVITGGLLELGLQISDFVVLLGGITLMALVGLKQRKEHVRVWIGRMSPVVQFFIWYGLFFGILLFGIYGIGYEESQFIYNQF